MIWSLVLSNLRAPRLDFVQELYAIRSFLQELPISDKVQEVLRGTQHTRLRRSGQFAEMRKLRNFEQKRNSVQCSPSSNRWTLSFQRGANWMSQTPSYTEQLKCTSALRKRFYAHAHQRITFKRQDLEHTLQTIATKHCKLFIVKSIKDSYQ